MMVIDIYGKKHETYERFLTDNKEKPEEKKPGGITYVEMLPPEDTNISPLRTFTSGATRDTEGGKHDYEGFLSPIVVRRYAEYMTLNRLQKDGSIRDSDNWQKGMDDDVYMKSMWRHFMMVWQNHRNVPYTSEDMETALCALKFNVDGLLHETVKKRLRLKGNSNG